MGEENTILSFIFKNLLHSKGLCSLEKSFVWLVSQRPCQLIGYIADGPQDRASDNFMCCLTRDTAGRP